MWVVSTLKEEKEIAALKIAVMVSPSEAARFAHGRTRGVHYSLLKPIRLQDMQAIVRAAFQQEVHFF